MHVYFSLPLIQRPQTPRKILHQVHRFFPREPALFISPFPPFLSLCRPLINPHFGIEALKRLRERQVRGHDEACFMQHCTMSISFVCFSSDATQAKRDHQKGIKIQFKNFMLRDLASNQIIISRCRCDGRGHHREIDFQ